MAQSPVKPALRIAPPANFNSRPRLPQLQQTQQPNLNAALPSTSTTSASASRPPLGPSSGPGPSSGFGPGSGPDTAPTTTTTKPQNGISSSSTFHAAPGTPPTVVPSSPQESPPYSPITPSDITDRLAHMKPYSRPTVLAAPPPAVPIGESTNPDAIALRSALALLQLQRETGRRDIVALEQRKQAAMRDPEAFLDGLRRKQDTESRKKEGERKKKKRRKETGNNEHDEENVEDVESLSRDRALLSLGGATAMNGAVEGKEGYLMPTLRHAVHVLGNSGGDLAKKTGTSSKLENTNADEGKDQGEDDDDDDEEEDDDDDEEEYPESTKFSTFPQPQNIFRCPPVNWAKYQIVGESLDKLHEEQQQRPTPGQPVPEPKSNGQARSAPYIIAAPYEPFVDAGRMDQHPMQTRRGSKKPL